jgi:tripartite ATP-independent transporter DctM subunit
MNETVIGITILFLLLAYFLTGIELAFGMAIMGFVGYAMIMSLSAAMNLLAKDFFDSVSSYGLTVIPLFVLMGQIAFNAGIAGRLYDSAHKFLGHIPGGLAIATVAGATCFKAICGSSAATTATFASVAVPQMDRFGYDKKLSAGIVAIVGTLGVLLPPSVILIIFGIITQQSIGRLFLAGLVPGLIIAAFYVGIIIIWCEINPSLGPVSEKYAWKERLVSLPEVVWPVLIFALMVGGLMAGVFTPTESGSIGALAVLALTLFKKDLNFKNLVKSLQESMRTTCMVIMLIAGSTIFGHCLKVTNLPSMAAEWAVNLPTHRHIVFMLIMVVYLLGGSFIDDLAFMILATPIFFPAIVKLGYDPLWAGIMIAVTVMIGSVIPPVAMCVFIVKNITKVPMGVIYKGCYPFMAALVAIIALLFMFPQICLFVPNWLMK